MYIRTDYETTEREVTSTLGNKYIQKRRRKIHYMICDQCNENFVQRSWYPKGRLHNNVKHFCKKCYDPAVCADLGRETGRKNRLKKVGQRGIDSLGYPTIYVGKDYPYSKDYGGRIREHIIVMEKHLKRALKHTGIRDPNSEVVHHINGNKTNNKLSNLQVMTQAEHNKCHAGNDGLVLEMFRNGLVGYNKRKRTYFLKMAFAELLHGEYRG